MTDETTNTDETMTGGSDSRSEPDLEEELRSLGKRFADVVQAAWTSEERRRVESELREGLRRFSEEVGRVYDRTRESPAGERVRSKLDEARNRAAESDAARRSRETLVQGLRRLSEELARLADRFTPAEEPHEPPEPGADENPPAG